MKLFEKFTRAKWITSGRENDRACSLPPETFQKTFALDKVPERARLFVTALGIYEVFLNGKRVGRDLFTPGYTDYKRRVQVQEYDVSSLLRTGENVLEVTVANGWYLGRIGNKYNVYGRRRALLLELDCGEVRVATDESWEVTEDGEVRFADFYDGETIDLRKKERRFAPVCLFDGPTPALVPHTGAFVREVGVLTPERKGNLFDFKQNFAGVVRLKVRAKEGTVLTVRHGEILMDGKLFNGNYRSAKATLSLICREGENEFCPTFTYMGFRYAEITGNAPFELLSVEGVVYSSEMARRGTFSCGNENINKLQSCIEWGITSNFVDIPTDCPQRDERMGWTGDICVFANTASYNFDTRAFFRKWLADLRSEQKDGCIPVTIPSSGMYEPNKRHPIPLMTWGDAAVIVPWNVYMNYGERETLEESYESMKACVEAERRAAEKRGFGDKKFLWNGGGYQFGDWCAPDTSWAGWTGRGKHLATLWYFNSVNIVRRAARTLGRTEDERRYSELSENIRAAFLRHYLKEDGTFRHANFMSMYVCALYFGILPEARKEAVAAQLARLVLKNDRRVMTGFPGTPYLLFALADNGYEELAFKVLLQEKCPGWMHMIKHGATTTWERWNAIEEDGSFFHGGAGMVSFNHYAAGAVGDFFYRRILGLEPLKAGYSRFAVRPVCGPLTHAEGSLTTAQGKIEIKWKKGDAFTLHVTVPEGASAEITLPSGKRTAVTAGEHDFAEPLA